MTPSKKRPYTDVEAQPQVESSYHLRKRSNRSQYAYLPFHQSNISPTSNALDPAHEAYNNMTSPSNADLSQLLLYPSPGLEGPGQPRPAYPSQINDLEPHNQDPQLASVGYHQPEPNPSLNSYPEPWNQQFVSGQNFQPPMNRAYSASWPRTSYSLGKQQYWPHSTSEMDYSVSGKNPPDSAYYTKSPATQSILSGECPTSSQHSLIGAMNAIDLPNEQIPYMVYQHEKPLGFPMETQPSSAEHEPENVPDLVCEQCPTVQIKNKSEFQKHQNRHNKPHKCDISGCNRKEGFTTKNDLDRHKKSIHQVRTGKSFMCAAPHCAKKNKIWPRADNFRQHIVRLHSDWEVQELMDKSWERGVSQGSSERGLVHSLEICQQSIYEEEEDDTTEHEMPYVVNLQEINKSSSVDSISNAYQQGEDGYSRATSQESINLCSVSTQGVGDTLDRDQEPIDQYQPVIISEDQHITPSPERDLAVPKSNSAKVPVPPKKKPLVVHHPNQDPGSSAWIDARESQTSNTNGSRTLSISADEASQAIALELSKVDIRNKEDMELVIRTSVLSLLSLNKSRKTSPQDSPCRELKDSEKGLECEYCHKKKKTRCDLTKHYKRHTRPYGCTFTKCPRRFGSKNDWKRHENTMHYQVEAWKCAEPKIPDGSSSSAIGGKHYATSQQCGRLSYRRESFIAHLHEFHGLGVPEKEDYVRDQCKKRRVGRNGQCGFWCGFCQTVVRLEKLGIEAWDERFNHIDDEHFKRGDRVEDWVPLEGEVPKGMAEMAEIGSGGGEVGEADDEGSDEEDSGPDVEGEAEGGEDVVVLKAGGSEEAIARAKAYAVATGKCPSSNGGASATVVREKVRRWWFCCKCGTTELSHTDFSCYMPQCNHLRCPGCRTEDRCVSDGRIIGSDKSSLVVG